MENKVPELVWVRMDSNVASAFRAQVPGGWLVMIEQDVAHLNEYNNYMYGQDWRTSVTFVPDPSHSWFV